MGDRGNVVVVQHGSLDGGEDGAIYLYSHWGGSSLAGVVQCALIRGRDRWDDEPYLARILFNEMTAGSELETQSFGLSTYLTDNEHDLVVVDAAKQTVSFKPPHGAAKASFAFADFVRRDLVAEHLAEENFVCASAASPKTALPVPASMQNPVAWMLIGAVIALALMTLLRRWTR